MDSKATIERMADHLRTAFAGSYFDGMRGPTSLFADRVESCYVPPRSTDGWFDGKALDEYQKVEERVMRSVMPDAHFADVQVLTRADDQIICVYSVSGHLRDHGAYAIPITMVYDVQDAKIVRVTGLYDQEKLRPFTDAFARAAEADDILIEMAPSSGATT